ncbi:hypothetical protein H0H92_016154 [Tricholoma furcatifolium]|nr:hypothetical protein H0H92_016154 [Tricholoma furcatifolium]
MVFWPTTVRAFSRSPAFCSPKVPNWRKKLDKKRKKLQERVVLPRLPRSWENLVEVWEAGYSPRTDDTQSRPVRPVHSTARYEPMEPYSRKHQVEDFRKTRLNNVSKTRLNNRSEPPLNNVSKTHLNNLSEPPPNNLSKTPPNNLFKTTPGTISETPLDDEPKTSSNNSFSTPPDNMSDTPPNTPSHTNPTLTLKEEALQVLSNPVTPPVRDPLPHFTRSPQVPIKRSSTSARSSRQSSRRRAERRVEDELTSQLDPLHLMPQLRLSTHSPNKRQHRSNMTISERLRLVQETSESKAATSSSPLRPPNPELGIKALDDFLVRGGIHPPPRLVPPDLSEIVKDSEALEGMPLLHSRLGVEDASTNGRRGSRRRGDRRAEPEEEEEEEVPYQRPNVFFTPRSPEQLHMEHGFKLNAIHARYKSFLAHQDVKSVVDLGAGDGAWSTFVAYKLARNYDPSGGLSSSSRLRGKELEGRGRHVPPHKERGRVQQREEAEEAVSLEGLFDQPPRVRDTIVAVDVREIPFMDGVHRVRGDVLDDATFRLIDKALRAGHSSSREWTAEDLHADLDGEVGRRPKAPPKVDVVLSDLVPEKTDDTLEYVGMSLQLCRRGWEFARSRLKSVDEVGRPKAGVLLMRHIPHPLLTSFRITVLEPNFEFVKYINPKIEQGIVDMDEDGKAEDDAGAYFICMGFKGAASETQRVWHKYSGPGIGSYIVK